MKRAADKAKIAANKKKVANRKGHEEESRRYKQRYLRGEKFIGCAVVVVCDEDEADGDRHGGRGKKTGNLYSCYKHCRAATFGVHGDVNTTQYILEKKWSHLIYW